MKKMFNKAVLNGTTVMGDGLTYPRIPNVYTGDNEGGYQRGDMMDANAVVEMIKELTDTGKITIDELKNLINEEIQERVEGDQDQQRYTDEKIKDLIGTSPETLDTLKEIADALGEDPDFAANVWNKIAELTTKHNEDVQELQDAITSGFENIDFTPYVKKTDVVTDTTNGLMLASDKTKLDAFKEADQYTKAIRLPQYIAGINDGDDFGIMTATHMPDYYSMNFILRSLKGNGYMPQSYYINSATSAKAGVMSAVDKQKLDSLVNYQAGNGIDITGDTISCTLDTSLYSIVTELPETGLPNKIYLLPSTKTEEGNIYTEYGYVDNKWEEIGKYKADVDLSPYAKALNLPKYVFGDSNQYLLDTRKYNGKLYLTYSSMDLVNDSISRYSIEIPLVKNDYAGLMFPSDKVKLDGIEAGAQVNTIESVSVNGTPLEVTNKGVNIPIIAGKGISIDDNNRINLKVLKNPESLGHDSYDSSYPERSTLIFNILDYYGPTNDPIGINGIKTYIRIPHANSENGLLGLITKDDYNIFNNKQDALTEAQLNNINNAITSISINNIEQVNTNGAVNLTIPNASITENGLMSKEDKAKLDSQPTIKASDATGVTDDDYVVIKKSEYQSILDRLSALENNA